MAIGLVQGFVLDEGVGLALPNSMLVCFPGVSAPGAKVRCAKFRFAFAGAGPATSDCGGFEGICVCRVVPPESRYVLGKLVDVGTKFQSRAAVVSSRFLPKVALYGSVKLVLEKVFVDALVVSA